jgi:hypothetical protein
MQEREVKGSSPYKGPSGSGRWINGHKEVWVDVMRRTGKEIYGEKLDGIT